MYIQPFISDPTRIIMRPLRVNTVDKRGAKRKKEWLVAVYRAVGQRALCA